MNEEKQNNIEPSEAPAASPAAADKEPKHQPTLQEVIRTQATDEDTPFTSALTLSKIMGGDILNTSAIRRQIWLVLLIMMFFIIYISNRYSCQQSLIEIDKLQKELKDVRYKAEATSTRLTEMSRESRVIEQLNACKDSTLHMPSQPPYLITIPEK